MEVFIVEAESSFEQELGNKLGGAYSRQDERIGGTQGGSSVGAPSGPDAVLSDDTANFGAGKDTILNFPAGAATSGIGILKKTGSAVLKVELEALEKQGLSKIISNPKIFSLDNQTATIKQGEQIPVAGGDGADTYKDAALVMSVTPSIIGDGNVLLDVKVNNDSPNRQNAGSVGINTMEINTKLLVADGDIVVIGGIKKNTISFDELVVSSDIQNLINEDNTILEQSDQNKIDLFSSMIISNIQSAWRKPINIQDNLVCEMLLTVNKNGRIIKTNLIKSSGNIRFDNSALKAVERVETFIFFGDIPQSLYQTNFKTIQIRFNPA